MKAFSLVLFASVTLLSLTACAYDHDLYRNRHHHSDRYHHHDHGHRGGAYR